MDADATGYGVSAMSDPFELTITAKGPRACGKSLGIDDMLRGLEERGHFHVLHKKLHASENNECAVFTVKLKREYTSE